MEKEGAAALVDPLANYWGLSLFPFPFPLPSTPYNTDQDLHTIHTHLRSMALRSPAKLLQQAKSIVDANPKLFNSEDSQKTNDAEEDGEFRPQPRPGLGLKRPRFSMKPTEKPSVEGLDLDNLKDYKQFFLAYERLQDSQKTNDAEEDGEFRRQRRQRRPGLGLKLPRFSMKPTKKPSVESLLPPPDLHSFKGYKEFFLAHERHENAKREIKKQLGIGDASFESDQDNASTRPRQRRPGLLGSNRMPLKYRHRYPREASDDVLSSQETLGSQSLDPVAENIDKGVACNASSENEVKDSSATEENKLDPDELLNELLSYNPEDLEGDRAINILQEKLQIKPIALEKISVPDFPDNPVIVMKSLQGNKSKPRKALSDIDNSLKGLKNRTPLVKAIQCPVQQLDSPTPPRSPFASLSTLQKHILQSRQSVDPFSFQEVYHLSSKNCSPALNKEPELNLVGSGKPSNEMNAHMIEDIIDVGKASTVLDIDGRCPNTSEISKEDNGKSSNKLNVPCTENIIAVGKTSLADDTIRNSSSTSQKSMVDNSREPSLDANNDSAGPGVDMDVDVGGSGTGERVMDDTEERLNIEAHMIEDVSAGGKTSTDLDTDINCTHTSEISKEDNYGKSSNKLNVPSVEDIIAAGGTSLAEDTVRHSTSTSQKSVVDNSREFDVNIESNEPHVDMDVDAGGSGLGERDMDDTEDGLNIEANESCQSEDKAENMQTFTASIPTDDTNLNVVNPLVDQSNPAEFQANAMDKRTRRSDDPEHCLQEKADRSMVPVNGQKRVKSRSQRVSKDKKPSKRQSLAAAGLRRSTRMRTRPLEYWKGERPVYGRVHESLVTVIGVKCMSPGSDGKPTMKVKSYVSDEHKELFELASLH